jgi:hypothetical protein
MARKNRQKSTSQNVDAIEERRPSLTVSLPVDTIEQSTGLPAAYHARAQDRFGLLRNFNVPASGLLSDGQCFLISHLEDPQIQS